MRARKTPRHALAHERFAFAVLRLAGCLTAITGMPLLMIAYVAPWRSAAAASPVGRFFTDAVGIGVSLCASGVAAFLLSSTWTASFARAFRRGRAPGAAIALGIGAVLLVVPVRMTFELAPLWSLWTEMLELFRAAGVWEAARKAGEFSGLILAPVLVVVWIPALLVATACWFAASSTIGLSLLATRSRLLVRALVACLLLQGGLVLACSYGARMVRVGVDVARNHVGTHPDLATNADTLRVLSQVALYDARVHAAHEVLWWTLLAYAMCLPVLLVGPNESDRTSTDVSPVVEAHASDDRFPVATAPVASAATEHGKGGSVVSPAAPPVTLAPAMTAEQRRRFYEGAARDLESDSPNPFAEQKPIVAVLAITVAAACFALPFLIRACRVAVP